MCSIATLLFWAEMDACRYMPSASADRGRGVLGAIVTSRDFTFFLYVASEALCWLSKVVMSLRMINLSTIHMIHILSCCQQEEQP